MRKPPKPRNPEAAELIRNPLYRTRVSKTQDERSRQRDPWERVAKHKGNAIERNIGTDDG